MTAGAGGAASGRDGSGTQGGPVASDRSSLIGGGRGVGFGVGSRDRRASARASAAFAFWRWPSRM